jgi:hypothetical protein
MSADLWIGAVTTLAGAVLGGSISLVLNRQQMKFEHVQRQESAQEERYRRSVDRRFEAYSDFLTRSRTFRNSIRPLAVRNGPKPDIASINEYGQAAHTASALVFLTTESAATHDACRLAVTTMSRIQAALNDTASRSNVMKWPGLNREMADVLRQFQVAARAELGVDGVEPSSILTHRSSDV